MRWRWQRKLTSRQKRWRRQCNRWGRQKRRRQQRKRRGRQKRRWQHRKKWGRHKICRWQRIRWDGYKSLISQHKSWMRNWGEAVQLWLWCTEGVVPTFVKFFFTERYFFIWSPHHRRHPQCSPPGSCMSGAPRGCGPSAHKKKFTAKHRWKTLQRVRNLPEF